MSANRIEWVDRMRGIAIISVVIQHLTMYFSYHDSLIYLKLIGACNMGVFFFVSGYIINKTSNINNIYSCFSFIKKKFLQLIIPLLFWGILTHYLFAKNVYQISYEDLYTQWKSPHLWYLLTLFGYTLPFPFYKLLFYKKSSFCKIIVWLIWNVLILILWKFTGEFKFAAMYLLSFVFGVLVSEYKQLEMHLNDKWLGTISIMFIFLFTNLVTSGAMSIFNSLIKLFLTFSAVILIYQLCNAKWKYKIDTYITKCGIYSIAIYAVHWYFLDINIFAKYIDTNNELITFLITSIIAMIISQICIWAKMIISKYNIFDSLMFGSKWRFK